MNIYSPGCCLFYIYTFPIFMVFLLCITTPLVLILPLIHSFLYFIYTFPSIFIVLHNGISEKYKKKLKLNGYYFQ
jgi:hypothetical protein